MLSNSYFLDSIPEHKIKFLHDFAAKKFDGNKFKASTEDAPVFKFFDEGVKKSKTEKREKFTNYVSKKRSEALKTKLIQLFEDPSIILKTEGETNSVTMNQRIRNCLSLYYPFNREDEDGFLKTDIRDAAGAQIGVRVFSTIDLSKEDGLYHGEYIIVLVDPHHLVIPTAHKGKKVQDVINSTYREHTSQGVCMTTLIK